MKRHEKKHSFFNQHATPPIPLLELEREYVLGATGQLKTRAQAFLERIER